MGAGVERGGLLTSEPVGGRSRATLIVISSFTISEIRSQTAS